MACDSIKQCPDGEDEINCLYLFSSTADILVADLGKINVSDLFLEMLTY